ncbi:hypothetical protein SAMN05421820_11656 [Pedobacter steynii]|uniref:Uncharacterized protein n=1 Tax=Pedobacter steynii TaxID=430522 RepID=A0A1H0KHI4_9SPHI|nr:hypothetical protein SAMN05421820_11656 [Pedobacter steynii]
MPVLMTSQLTNLSVGCNLVLVAGLCLAHRLVFLPVKTVNYYSYLSASMVLVTAAL